MNFQDQLKALAEQHLNSPVSKEEQEEQRILKLIERLDNDDWSLTSSERILAIKERSKRAVSAMLDRKEEMEARKRKQEQRFKEVQEFQKKHNAKMRQKIIQDKIDGKY